MSYPDNYDMWEASERRKEAWLAGKPICSYCGQPIQDDRLFDINGLLYHEECAREEFLKYTEDYE